MKTTLADSWLDFGQPCDIDLMGHEMMVTMTYISRSGDFALHLADYLMYEHHTLEL